MKKFEAETKFGKVEVTATQVTASRIEKLRKEKGLTQLALSQKIGDGRSFIWNVEGGRRNLTLENLQKICEALECSSQDLIPF